MLEKEVRQKIIAALAEEFEIEHERLKPEATLYEDLGFDSLDAIDMVVVLEKTFGVKLSDETAIRSVRTVGDIFTLISKIREETAEKE